jgi:hypothetical protein
MDRNSERIVAATLIEHIEFRDANEAKNLRFFADGAAKKWPLRGSLKRVSAFLITCRP